MGQASQLEQNFKIMETELQDLKKYMSGKVTSNDKDKEINQLKGRIEEPGLKKKI